MRHAYTPGVLTGLTILVVAIGLVLMAAHPLAGLLIVAVGYAIFRRSGVRDEELFTAALAVLAGAGALLVFGQYLLERLNWL